MQDDAPGLLQNKIAEQNAYLDEWKRPVEPLLFETLRAIDHLFCQELFLTEDSEERLPSPEYSIASWGVNKALSRMVPDKLVHGQFKLFPSSETTQSQADELLFQAGALETAERLLGWMTEGLVTARLDTPKAPSPHGPKQILVLNSEHPGLFCEVVSRKHREWMSDLTVAHDREWEVRLAERQNAIIPELERNLDTLNGWGITYSTTREIDNHFLECGQLYLRRMWSQDLLGLEDKVGGCQFNEYLGVLAALSGRAQKHLCFAAMLRHRCPDLDVRNLLTTFAPHDDLILALAEQLDAEALHVQKLLSSLTLDPTNRDVHTQSGEPVWAPVVRSSVGFCILPLYGLEINPFLFLLNDLQFKYPDDWSRIANNRESRWLVELQSMFASERWQTVDRNVVLRTSRKTVTDIDFLAYDALNNELAIFQLKWQQPVGMDNRARRSAGKNLITTGNKWVEAVSEWLDAHGTEELGRRAGVAAKSDARVCLFVIARYNALFSGYSDHDTRATWADWNHFMKARMEAPNASMTELAETILRQVREISSSFPGESYAIPLSDLAIVLNPISEPSTIE